MQETLTILYTYIFGFLPYLFLILAVNSIVFLFACKKSDNSIADIFYSYSFMIAASAAILSSKNIQAAKILLFIFITIWGKRLFFRIYLKNKDKPEDFRYASWRNKWLENGKFYFYTRSYLQVFVLQGVIAFIIMLPAIQFLNSDIYMFANFNLWIFIIGSLIWIFGFVFESIGDYQLDNFLKNKVRLEKEKIMTAGLWKYTRHPNYFGESTMWWGIFIASVSILDFGNALNIILFIILLSSPLLITFLLRFVSGVPMLEKRWDETEDVEVKKKWLKYKKSTPAMLPKFY